MADHNPRPPEEGLYAADVEGTSKEMDEFKCCGRGAGPVAVHSTVFAFDEPEASPNPVRDETDSGLIASHSPRPPEDARSLGRQWLARSLQGLTDSPQANELLARIQAMS